MEELGLAACALVGAEGHGLGEGLLFDALAASPRADTAELLDLGPGRDEDEGELERGLAVAFGERLPCGQPGSGRRVLPPGQLLDEWLEILDESRVR